MSRQGKILKTAHYANKAERPVLQGPKLKSHLKNLTKMEVSEKSPNMTESNNNNYNNNNYD